VVLQHTPLTKTIDPPSKEIFAPPEAEVGEMEEIERVVREGTA
jgi:hypothetical protein